MACIPSGETKSNQPHAHVTRLVVASPTCREQPSRRVSDGALTLREQAGSAASCDPPCRRCAPWPIMMVSQSA